MTAAIPNLREAKLADYAQIAAVQARNGLGALPCYEEWAHLWLHNPAYLEMKRWPIGWVLETEAGIVGSMSNIPLPYELGGNPLLASTGRGWAVDPPYRAHAFLLLDKVINQDRVDLYVNNFFNNASVEWLNIFGCSPVPGKWNEAGVWVTGYRTFAEAALRYKSFPAPRAVSYPMALGLYCRDRVRLPRLAARYPGVELQVCSSFDERFDEFWSELRKGKPDVLLAVRTREMLSWHFKYPLLKNRLWAVAALRGSRMLAYAVFDRKDKPSLGLKRMRVMDFQAVTGQEHLCDRLLSWALDKCRREGLHLLEDPGCSMERAINRGKIAPYHHQRQIGSSGFVYKALVPELAGLLKSPQAWQPSPYDGDATL